MDYPKFIVSNQKEKFIHKGLKVCFFFCLVFAIPLCASVYMCLVVICWERADLISRLLCLTVSLSLSHWYPGSGVVLDCIDS